MEQREQSHFCHTVPTLNIGSECQWTLTGGMLILTDESDKSVRELDATAFRTNPYARLARNQGGTIANMFKGSSTTPQTRWLNLRSILKKQNTYIANIT